MTYRLLGRLVLLASCVVFHTAPEASAQTATMQGTVRDAESGAAVAGATVQALTVNGSAAASSVSDAGGRFSLDLVPGRYDVVVSAEPYESFRAARVPVQEGLAISLDIALSRSNVVLNPIVVSGSRRQEKALDAPTHVEVVEPSAIESRVTLSPLEHIHALPGVDVATTGLIQGSAVARGFNGVFSGAMLTLVDNRSVSIPSLRVNVPYIFPPDLDVERVEVLLGPASALYGPNSANGVLHVVSRSPFAWPGTSISLTSGERSVFGASGRHAQALGERVAYKLVGSYYRGSDWEYLDPVEVSSRVAAEAGDPATLIGLRNYEQELFKGEARVDVRLGSDTEVILAGGALQVGNAVELTGLGAAQIRDWRHTFGQARLQRGRFFAQAFLNTSHAGDTYLLRTGTGLVDRSTSVTGQIQHGVGLVDEAQQLTYGLDYQLTTPRTDGTILGRNEGVRVHELGAYLQSETAVRPWLDLIAAARWDTHNHLENPVFSPRAGIVVRPGALHNLRLTYNRAFETPTSNHLFLDLESTRLDPLPFSVRALGVPREGLRFQRDCGGGLCMRSPFDSGQDPLPVDATRFWPAVVDLMRARGVDISGVPAPLATEVGSVLRVLDTTTGAFSDVQPSEVRDIEPLRPTITNTFEFGYQGLLGSRLILSADVYHTRKQDFIGPLTVETPSVFLDRESLSAYLGRYLPRAQAEQLAAGIGGVAGSADVKGIPLGTIVPDGDLTQSADLVVTYRNFGEVSHWGGDASAELLLPGGFSMRGVYSYISDNYFAQEALGGLGPVALNAPKHKGAVSGLYRSPGNGFNVELRARHSGEFPMSSGVYTGQVEEYSLFDALISYRLPIAGGVRFSVTAQNLLDERHQEFVGAPEVGRLIMTRLKFDF